MGGGLVSSRPSTFSIFYTFDERGDVAQRLGSTGSVQSTDKYDAFGARASTAVQTDPWGFGGQFGYFTDKETGLVLCTHRFYDPANGRFLTRDPSGYGGGVNLYGYTANDPVNDSDPSGTSALSDWYWGGMGGLSSFVSANLLNGSDTNLGHVVGEHDAGCASAADVAWAGAQFGGNLALNAIPGGGEARAAEVGGNAALHLAEDGAADVAQNVVKRRFTPDQQAVLALAKEAERKGGTSWEESETLVQWGKEAGLEAHGPEIHDTTRPSTWSGKNWHINIGNMHIPVK